ncbi:MAG: RNA polymerase sigma factor [Deltaproteobacteria bacterium]
MEEELPRARIERAQAGDREAAGEVLRAVLPRVRNLVRYLVRGDGDVDDIAQQCLVAVLRGLPTFRGDGAFTSWVDRIVARRTFVEIDKLRKARAREAEVDVELMTVGPADEYLARRRVARLLDGLPEDQRRAVVLHHCVGMSVPEIAELLEVPFDTAKSRLRLGMKKLRSAEATT